MANESNFCASRDLQIEVVHDFLGASWIVKSDVLELDEAILNDRVLSVAWLTNVEIRWLIND